MLTSNVIYTLSGLAMKLVLKEATPANAYFFQVVGALATSTLILIFWAKGRMRLQGMLAHARPVAFASSGFNEVLATAGGLATTAALSTGYLAVVSSLSATQPIFIAGFGQLVGLFRPTRLADHGLDKGHVTNLRDEV